MGISNEGTLADQCRWQGNGMKWGTCNEKKASIISMVLIISNISVHIPIHGLLCAVTLPMVLTLAVSGHSAWWDSSGH